MPHTVPGNKLCAGMEDLTVYIGSLELRSVPVSGMSRPHSASRLYQLEEGQCRDNGGMGQDQDPWD